jgi:lipid-binding SYLF domain-containing protein
MKSRRFGVLAVMALFAALALGQAEDQKKEQGGSTERERVKESGEVLKQILDAPDKGIPKSVLDGSKCVIVLPSVKKMAVGIGGSYGRGVMTCRTGSDYKGPWSAPIMMASSGGSVGFQIGGQATDFVIIVMNDGGAKSLLNSKVKLGADASVAAGPVGRTAEASTNARVRKVSSAECPFLDRPCVPTVMPMRISIAKRLNQRRLLPARYPCQRKPSN